MGAQRREQGVGLARVDDPRQRARGADQRHPAIRATCRQPVWHRILGDHTADDQILEQDVLGFIRSQRQPRRGVSVVRIEDGEAGLSARTIKRRLASVSAEAAFDDVAGRRRWVRRLGCTRRLDVGAGCAPQQPD